MTESSDGDKHVESAADSPGIEAAMKAFTADADNMRNIRRAIERGNLDYFKRVLRRLDRHGAPPQRRATSRTSNTRAHRTGRVRTARRASACCRPGGRSSSDDPGGDSEPPGGRPVDQFLVGGGVR